MMSSFEISPSLQVTYTVRRRHMTFEIDKLRRSLCGTAAVTLAASPFFMLDTASAGHTRQGYNTAPSLEVEGNTTFQPLKQINAGLLNVGYAEAGPADG